MIYFWCRQKVFQIMAQYWTQLFQFQPHLRLQFQYQNTQRNGDGSNATHSPVSRLLFSTTLNYTSTTLFEFEKWEVEELLLEQTSFGISGLWWCSSPLSHPAVITGLVLSWLPVGERDKGQLDSAANTPPAARAAATAACSSTSQGEVVEEESVAAMQKAKVRGGVSSTTAANNLQAAPSPHDHSIPITPKSQA